MTVPVFMAGGFVLWYGDGDMTGPQWLVAMGAIFITGIPYSFVFMAYYGYVTDPRNSHVGGELNGLPAAVWWRHAFRLIPGAIVVYWWLYFRGDQAVGSSPADRPASGLERVSRRT